MYIHFMVCCKNQSTVISGEKIYAKVLHKTCMCFIGKHLIIVFKLFFIQHTNLLELQYSILSFKIENMYYVHYRKKNINQTSLI